MTMKKSKILLSIIFACILAVSAGCGNAKPQADTGTATVEGEPDAVNGLTGAKTAEAEALVDGGDGFAADAVGEAFDAAVGAETPNIGGNTSPDEPMIQPEAGLLTAGQWTDNDNWGFFSNLVNSDTITFPSFGLDPRNRALVNVKTAEGKPVVNAKVNLLDKENNILWSAVTDKQGRGFLFVPESKAAASVEVECGGKKQSVPAENMGTGTQGEQLSGGVELDVTLDAESTLYKPMDIMFIVDATGSMSDEMTFLQKEFTAITNEIGTDNVRYAVNFYRDEGDDYITKCNDFTDNIKELQTVLNNEFATGGGDTPEAVAEVLNDSVFKSNWNDESVKLAFLIFDAPPHDGKEEEIRKAVSAASEKGIRIIPVVSSNSDRETELFGRALSIVTGGTYVFLTDDSGIGDSHLEPIIGSYEVRSLYDIIIDIINDYRQG